MIRTFCKKNGKKVVACWAFCLLLISVKAQHVVQGEQQISLNGNWHFKIDANNVGEEKQWYATNVYDANWDSMPVPGNWDVTNQYAQYKGKAWYRTTFATPAANAKKVFLSFGEVGMSYTVYLNGKKIAEVLCGNYQENFDITARLKKGANNQLTVMVDNSLIWGAYWSWGGFRRSVNLVLKTPVYIQQQHITAIPDLTTGTATVYTKVLLQNTTATPQQVQIAQVLSFKQQVVNTANPVTLTLQPNTATSYLFTVQLAKEKVQLWHFDHPNLYQSAVSITHSQQPKNLLINRFGVRKIEIDGYHFKLNGESVRLNGYNWVADDRTTGSVLPEFRYKADIDRMKQAGANMARLSHRPLPEDVMDYLDEKGMLVLAEFNNWPAFMNAESKEPEHFAAQLVTQNFNHPSIFGWSVGNENGNLKENPKVNEYVASIIKYIKQNLDSTRLVTYVSNTADYQDNDAAQYCDVVMINKYGNFEQGVDALRKRYPNKAVFMSEYGSHTDNLIYETPDKTLFKSMMVDNLIEKPNLFGVSLWTFNDYRSSYQSPNPATATPLHQNRQWGIVDVYRNKKRAFTQMQHFYAPVRNMAVTVTSSSKHGLHAHITLQPRHSIDLPAFVLRGYQLVWEIRGKNNINEQMGWINLPNIAPGSDTMQYAVDCPKSATAAFFKVSLLSPTGYVVLDTVVHLIPPPPPVITDFIKAAKDMRVLFQKNDFSTQFTVKYSADGTVKSLAPTIDHYADLLGLSINKNYKVWVVASNNAGESMPSEEIAWMPTSGYTVLPPVIWLSEPGDKCFFTGYSFHYADNQYEIRYGQSLQLKDRWKIVNTSNFGIMQIPDLQNGKTYYYQLRKKTAFTATPNEWSEVKTIVPTPTHQYGNTIVQGFCQKGNQLLISCTPATNASSFSVVCSTKTGQQTYLINRADISVLCIEVKDGTIIEGVSIK